MKDPVPAPWDMDVMQGGGREKEKEREGGCYDIV